MNARCGADGLGAHRDTNRIRDRDRDKVKDNLKDRDTDKQRHRHTQRCMLLWLSGYDTAGNWNPELSKQSIKQHPILPKKEQAKKQQSAAPPSKDKTTNTSSLESEIQRQRQRKTT
jgi:hypothetical protein